MFLGQASIAHHEPANFVGHHFGEPNISIRPLNDAPLIIPPSKF